MTYFYEVRTQLESLTRKESLGPLRLAMALLWFAGFYFVFRRFETRIDRMSRGVLKIVGENSLLVYVIQAVMVFAVLAYIGQKQTIIISTLLTSGGIALAYLCAR